MEALMGTVVCFAGPYAPLHWAFCDGQTIPISQNQSLFLLLGTRYGGDGRNTFKLPDLRGRTAVSAGQSVFNKYELGDSLGSESVKLEIAHMPSHTHSGDISLHLPANSVPGSESAVNGGFPAEYAGAYSLTGKDTMLAPDYSVTIGNTGSAAPVNTRSPFLVLNYIICLQGIYPSRQ